MFTGIIESLGILVAKEKDQGNVHLDIQSDFTSELKIDQSIAHNGACLTVVAIDGDQYRVTVIDESLRRTNLGNLKPGDRINLERCMIAGARLDGHMVQGHVDQVGYCEKIEETGGSWKFWFSHKDSKDNITVEKGSICVNGVSLTVVDSEPGQFSVAIIPYTHAHTNFHQLEVGDPVNLEFDILGKYIARLLAERSN
jgi:riboflavin synthase